MNKKRLSVVMAGAMLATSVAPVLAATETVVNESERGLLIKRLRELMNSKVFTDLNENDKNKTDKLTGHKDSVGESAYYVKVDGEIFWLSRMEELETKLQNAPTGTVVEVYDRGHVEKDGKVYNHALENVIREETYTKAELAKLAEDFAKPEGQREGKYSDVIYSMEYKDGVLKVVVRKAADESKHVELSFKEGDREVEFSVPMNKDNEQLLESKGEWANFDHFRVWEPTKVEKGQNLPEELIETIKLTDVDAHYETVLSKLYDGLFLTENGNKLLETIKEYDKHVKTAELPERFTVVKNARGIYELNLEFVKYVNKDTVKQTVTIKSNNKAQLELFASGISSKGREFHTGNIIRKFPVQKLVGEDRYATAVKIAKENANIDTVALNGNIVLVNGNSLVDGLAAAPLAASVVNKVGNAQLDEFVAPILLTSANGLPKATKDYMKDLVAHQMVGNLNKVTVYLVGGEAVISDAVVNELEEIGLRVVRAGGKDREETSLKVAKLMKEENGVNTKDAFVVGADGEADAMSVAAYAAQEKTPIIVESRKGISDNTIEYLRGYKNASGKGVTIVGGENVVSKETETKLATKDITVDRLAGSNRKATNAKVIKAFYANNKFNHIVVSPDGQADKNASLIDALTATSIAASNKSPIVLATNKLTNDQLNALELTARRDGVYVYQIGGRVADAVTRTIASRINLAK